MGNSRLLSLSEVARLTALSGGTLRRYIKEGRLKAEPRFNDQQPYWVSLDNLEASGLDLVAEPPSDASSPTGASNSRLLAQIESFRSQVEDLQREKLELLERAARAEGALSVAKEQLKQWSQRTRRGDSTDT